MILRTRHSWLLLLLVLPLGRVSAAEPSEFKSLQEFSNYLDGLDKRPAKERIRVKPGKVPWEREDIKEISIPLLEAVLNGDDLLEEGPKEEHALNVLEAKGVRRSQRSKRKEPAGWKLRSASARIERAERDGKDFEEIEKAVLPRRLRFNREDSSL